MDFVERLFGVASGRRVAEYCSKSNGEFHMLSCILRLVVAVWVVSVATLPSFTQSESGSIYKAAESSVFLIYLNDASGQPTALGSGFLIGPRSIITNAHVVAAGTPVIAVGPVRIPAKILKTDEQNDLCLLGVDVDLTSKPLVLSKNKVEIGDKVFAIGNPEGLEKTLSEGIISSLREDEGHRLLQITTPISHGSSGGPVLNLSGEVVGVTVSMLKEGQNLNFAIPASVVALFMNSKEEGNSLDVKHDLLAIKAAFADRTEDYSSDENSQYQVKSKAITRLLNQALHSDDPSALIELAESSQDEDYDISLKAAQKSDALRSSPQAKLLIAHNLSMLVIFAKSEDQASLRKEAEDYASRALKEAKVPSREYLTTLAYTKEQMNENAAALALYKRASSTPNGNLGVSSNVAIRGEIRNSIALNLVPERRAYFRQLADTGDVSAQEWSDEAYRLLNDKDKDHHLEAIAAFQNAARLSKDGIYWCRAALNEGFVTGFDKDVLLRDSKQCLSQEAIKPTENIDDLNGFLATINVVVANTLNTRGVYSEALNYAKDATKLAPTDSAGFDSMADAYYYLQRYNESVSAEREAIRLSDGKYAYMHFRLGADYFELEQWKSAESSFEQAWREDTTNDNTAYNIALCYAKQSDYTDAVQWYKRVLTINPKREDKAEILKTIDVLSQ